MVRWAWVIAAVAVARPGSAAVKDHRASMCSRCKDGGVTDGGTTTIASIGCVHWCSRAGYCGDGDSYRAGLDCRKRGDLDSAALARARAAADAAAGARYDRDFLQDHGRLTFEQYKRGADHGERYGAAISIRGERHSGTGWVRVMTTDNCRERHYWSPKLDSDGLYGWKHDFLPTTLSAESKDAVVVVYRSAVPWVLKMRKTAYSAPIDRIGGAQARFLSVAFAERTVRFASVVELRSRKYAQYLGFGVSHKNVLGARYEDLTVEPTYLFEALAALSFDCNVGADFAHVKGYAKFGGAKAAGKGGAGHYTAPKNASWSSPDWLALVDRLDPKIERSLGYAYARASPGLWSVSGVPPGVGVLRP